MSFVFVGLFIDILSMFFFELPTLETTGLNQKVASERDSLIRARDEIADALNKARRNGGEWRMTMTPGSIGAVYPRSSNMLSETCSCRHFVKGIKNKPLGIMLMILMFKERQEENGEKVGSCDILWCRTARFLSRSCWGMIGWLPRLLFILFVLFFDDVCFPHLSGEGC